VGGEIVMEVITDFPERLRRGLVVYVGPGFSPHTFRSVRRHAEGLLVAFTGQMDRDAIAELRNKSVYVRAEELPSLPEGEYYHHQVIGLRVFNKTGEELGTLTEILETGAHDVYLIRPKSGQDILLPVLESTILEVDLERGRMRVHVLPGILPDEQEPE
jgi:16S rRNA processing protein RimM